MSCRSWFVRYIVDFSSKFLDARQTCRVAFPLGGCCSLPSGLARRSVHSFCSWLSVFLYQVTALPPSPCLVWIFRHSPCPSFESLTPELRLVYPSPPSRLLGRRCWISSAPRFVGFTVPTVQTRAKSHWETVGFSREVRFPLPVSVPRRLRRGCLSFPAALTMKVFSTFLGLLLAPDADVLVVPACLVVLPSPSSASQVTLSIAPCLLC